MGRKRTNGPEGASLAIAIGLLLFTPMLGGHGWWPLLVAGVTVVLTLAPVRRRTRRRIERCAADPR
jgi:hypothetical protein